MFMNNLTQLLVLTIAFSLVLTPLVYGADQNHDYGTSFSHEFTAHLEENPFSLGISFEKTTNHAILELRHELEYNDGKNLGDLSPMALSFYHRLARYASDSSTRIYGLDMLPYGEWQYATDSNGTERMVISEVGVHPNIETDSKFAQTSIYVIQDDTTFKFRPYEKRDVTDEVSQTIADPFLRWEYDSPYEFMRRTSKPGHYPFMTGMLLKKNNDSNITSYLHDLDHFYSDDGRLLKSEGYWHLLTAEDGTKFYSGVQVHYGYQPIEIDGEIFEVDFIESTRRYMETYHPSGKVIINDSIWNTEDTKLVSGKYLIPSVGVFDRYVDGHVYETYHLKLDYLITGDEVMEKFEILPPNDFAVVVMDNGTEKRVHNSEVPETVTHPLLGTELRNSQMETIREVKRNQDVLRKIQDM